MPTTIRRRKVEGVLPNVQTAIDSDLRAAMLAQQIVTDQIINIRSMTYASYCALMLGMQLTEGQAAITSVIFDGKPPDEKYADAFFGGKITPDTFSCKTAAVVVGRGSGKSRCFLAARGLHLAMSADLSMVGPADPPSLVAIIAPDQRQARQTLSFIKGFLEERPILKQVLKAEVLQEVIRITRPDGKRVNIEARPAAAGGNSVRGPVLIGVLLEESAFFDGEGFEVNDEEIFRAARPRLIPTGQIVFASTPWAQSGKLWELYRDNFGKPDSAVVCKAPTLLVRPSDDTRRAYEAELKNDPDNARREYDAEFLTADSERFFPEVVVQKCLEHRGVPAGPLLLPVAVKAGEKVRFGGDFAFASDSSAIVGFVERDGILTVCELDEQRPTAGLPLVPSKVVARFAKIMQRCGCRLLVADDHYRQAVQEHLSEHGVALTSVGNTPAHSYILARTLMAQGRVWLPEHPRLLAQLRRVRATQKPGGVVTIHQPRSKEGGHGDIVSALVCALSGVTTDTQFKAERPANEDERMMAWAENVRRERLLENERRNKRKNNRMLNLRNRWQLKF